MIKVINDRYNPREWNIYGAQASDGDNWADDSPHCRQLMSKKILPISRYFAYIEITQRPHQTLWQQYIQVQEQNSHFAMQHIKTVEDIYPVFRELFKKNIKQVA